MSEIPAVPTIEKRRRDALGQLCFALHLVIMLFIVFGWVLPQRGVLVFYLVLLPTIVVQWLFNRNTCVLNNAESLFRTGRWRDPGNAEEGAWFAGLVRSVLRVELRPAQLNAFIYVMLILFWGLALNHLLHG